VSDDALQAESESVASDTAFQQALATAQDVTARTEAALTLGAYAQAEVAAEVASDAATGSAASSAAGAASASAAGLSTGVVVASVGAVAAVSSATQSKDSSPASTADTTAPVLQSAAVHSSGNKIILTYNEALHATTATANAFTVKVAGASRNVTQVAVNGNTVELTLASAVAAGASVTVAYTAPSADATTGNAAVQDSAGNDAASFAATAVTNPANTAPVNTVPVAQTVSQGAPLYITGLAVTDDGIGGATLSVTLSVSHGTISVAGAPGVVQSGTGTNDNITLTGTLADVNAALAATHGVTYRNTAGYAGADTLQMRTQDAGSPALSDTDSVGITVNALTSTQAFNLWQEAETAWTEQQANGSTTHNIEALNAYSPEIVQQHDTTSRDGSANQSDSAKRLTQWVDQITGTDIVSQAEYQAGFTITGHAAAGAQGVIKFWLDNDRTNGVNEVGTQLQDGANGVRISYDNATGEYTIRFDANSAALKPATHNTWGSGIHQLTVDSDGSGAKNGSEASRLFLVADGTAQSTDGGSVAKNYSVQDAITNDVFVYYYGDPDGVGVGLWTALDNGDTNLDATKVTTDKDGLGGAQPYGDYDYYASALSNATAVTASNTALHLTTNISAKTWEFHMANQENVQKTWDEANTAATDHASIGSNTSRLASLQEMIALYAANFGGSNGGDNTEGSKTVGAIQPMDNTTSSFERTPTAAEDNRPRGWDHDGWTTAPVPGGHAVLDMYYANIAVFPSTMLQNGVVTIL